ncbi:hypothetical protein V6N13_124008 [Hibiscus sabdariffa]|uniref:Transposase MuDR plant domain-containing protein n=1 Tax=Hibiscus sabdariffa TaxID=183260 RepID=A0ABR2CPE8_9ROSI
MVEMYGDVNSGPHGCDASSGPIGLDIKACDVDNGPFNASARENNYETNEDSSGSYWLGGESFLSDDEDEEVILIKNKNKAVKRKIKSEAILAEDLEHAVFSDALGEDGSGASDDLREDSEGGSSTEYLESSDAGSYEIDLEGDSIVKKSNNVFYTSTVQSRFELGMIFENQQQLKDALYSYTIAHRFDFKYVSNRKEKTRVVCKVKGCPFLLHASWDKSDGFYKIKTLVVEHQCFVTFKNKRADFILVGKNFLSNLRIVPNLKLIDMIRLVREELSVEINKYCCQKAKKWALE